MNLGDDVINLLEIGDKVYIIFDTIVSSPVEVLEISRDGVISVKKPQYNNTLMECEKGDYIDIHFYLEQSLFSYKAKIEDSFENDGESFIKIKRISGIVQKQRRKYYRINKKLPVTIKIDGRMYSSYTLDISEGGLSLAAPEHIVKNTDIVCKISFSNNNDIIVNSKVVWIDFDESGYPVKMGIKFVDLDEEDRKKLRDYVFEEQKKNINFKKKY